jgi:hypothetical protein
MCQAVLDAGVKVHLSLRMCAGKKQQITPVLNDPNWQPQHYLRFFLVKLTCPEQRLMAGSA